MRFSPSLCRLIFAGKQMNDDKQAKDYNIEGGSVLHLVSTRVSCQLSERLRMPLHAWWGRPVAQAGSNPARYTIK